MFQYIKAYRLKDARDSLLKDACDSLLKDACDSCDFWSLVGDGLYDPDDLLQRYGMLVSSENVNLI